MTLYSDTDPYAAAWLRNLIAAGQLTPGTVNETSITDLTADVLHGYTRVHLFAGIGGWDHALFLAGWPHERPVWTGSCPCQPFSSAGKRRGTADERHLWPHMLRLIAECRPATVFGEQVASPDGRAWLAGVRADLEALGYAVGAADLCAAGVAAPHIRQRLYWVANAGGQRVRGVGCGADDRAACRVQGADGQRQRVRADAWAGGATGRMGIADRHGPLRRTPRGEHGEAESDGARALATAAAGDALRLGDTDECRRDEDQAVPRSPASRARVSGLGSWDGYHVVWCRDPRGGPEIPRRVEPGTQQMADGFSESMGRLCSEEISRVEKGVMDAAKTEVAAREALLRVWEVNAEKAVQREVRRRLRVWEAPVLLAFLRELRREGWKLIDHLPPSCFEDAEAGLRELRCITSKTSCPSSGRKPGEQRPAEHQDVMPAVSQTLASSLQEIWKEPFPLTMKSPGRVGRLRGYGNAIVPQLAAEFIAAYLEAEEDMMLAASAGMEDE